jgi:hypothetical protein
MRDWEPYAIQVIPIVTLGVIYGLLGFELAVVMGLGMIAGTMGTRT